MTTLHLGEIEAPYAEGGITTAQVGTILERKYGIMNAFYEAHGQEIADALADGVQGQIESLFMGASVSHADPFAAGTSKIDEMFHKFIESGEIEAMGIEGVPTKASLKRKSARFKKGKSPGPRVSFYDTGLYDIDFKSWVDDRVTISGLSGWL